MLFDSREDAHASRIDQLLTGNSKVMFCSCNVAFSSLPVFLPTIINEYVHALLAKVQGNFAYDGFLPGAANIWLT